jgi:hypothetical protein
MSIGYRIQTAPISSHIVVVDGCNNYRTANSVAASGVDVIP